MLATMGYITPEVAGHWPGYLSFSEKVKFADIPNGLSAISKVPGLGWFQIIAYAAFCEINAGYDADINKRNEPGNMGWRPPLFSGSDPETRKRRLASELANGRLAMMAIVGMLFQDGLTGSAWGDWALYTDSPLRAFENELGAQARLGVILVVEVCTHCIILEVFTERSLSPPHLHLLMLVICSGACWILRSARLVQGRRRLLLQAQAICGDQARLCS
jgi:hypothetical protein